MVLEVRAALILHFCENFIKQNLKGTPANGGWVRVDQVPDLSGLPKIWMFQLAGALQRAHALKRARALQRDEAL